MVFIVLKKYNQEYLKVETDNLTVEFGVISDAITLLFLIIDWQNTYQVAWSSDY